MNGFCQNLHDRHRQLHSCSGKCERLSIINEPQSLSSTVVNNFREKTPGVSKINYRI